MPDDIEQRVIEGIARKTKRDPASITVLSTFEELDLDSLDAADLLFALENALGIVVPDQVALSMRSVGDVVEGIRRLLDEHGRTTPGS